MVKNITNCPICYAKITPDEEQITCPNCQIVYHTDCWKDNNGCATYGCHSTGCLNPPPIKIDLKSEGNMPHSSNNKGDYVCPNCHTKLVGGTTLCWLCGSELRNIPGKVTQLSRNIFIVVLVILLGIVIAVVIFNKK